MIDFRIETFLCVCRYMNYTRAAKELHITQPAVSQHIRYIEDYYGVKLFTYDKKILELTEAGTDLKNAMMSIKHDTLQLKNTLLDREQGMKSYHFGATRSIGDFYLPPLLASFASAYPSVSLNLKIANTHELLSLLDDGSIDFAFIEGYFPKDEYDHLVIKEERFVAVCGTDYPSENIHTFDDLTSHTLILREDGSGSKEILAGCLLEHGYSFDDFRKIHVFNSPNLIRNFLCMNQGIGFLYESVVHDDLTYGRVKELELREFNIHHEYCFIWRRNSIYAGDHITFYNQLMNAGGLDG